MLHWLFHALLFLVACVLIAAGGYGTFYFYRDAMSERATVAQLSKERAADVAAAGAHAKTCAADVAAGVKAGVAIGRIAAPRPRHTGAPQPMVTADQIAEAIR
ncbi:MAG: hypothetical protein ACYDD1_06765 [Caulobacteraceae bacterium]